MTKALTRFRSWAAARRVARDFSTVPAADIAGALVEARRTVELVGLDRDRGHETVMTLARQRLTQLANGECTNYVPTQRDIDAIPECRKRP
jgi:hypothetical protein